MRTGYKLKTNNTLVGGMPILRTTREVSQIMGISFQRVNQIEQSALEKIRRAFALDYRNYFGESFYEKQHTDSDTGL
ncbi:MAG TPA: sigma factor-like helix-turn-helix DNA-binding protein [Prosthecobacter sp.]|nr:sigma factor-like helix-turn-helix DNA-binding protein [Prosthecobacter sp.]